MQFFYRAPFVRLLIPFIGGIIAEVYLFQNRTFLFAGAGTGIALFILMTGVKSCSFAFKYEWAGGLGINLSLFFMAALVTYERSCTQLCDVRLFSPLILARYPCRNPNLVNLLAASCLLMLMADPMLIFFKGFLLPFLAMLGIGMWQPGIVNWFKIKHKVLNQACQLLSAVVSAGLALAPFYAGVSVIQRILLYILILSGIAFLKRKKGHALMVSLISILVLLLICIFEKQDIICFCCCF
jgi:hypothetical protein